ncbi:MAG: LLM class flavin-dependent oxidoreductase [Acidimicrobiia bacterium]|nr:LLM class flavin-dependent oxidoreductase [Acidimicrobiia bacterium]
MEFHLFLPQMRLSFERLVTAAKAAEAAGFRGIAGTDHFAPPTAEHHTLYEAMVTSTWLAAHTQRLVVGSLVLCDAFRHPAVLAREAVTLDHASGGRFELGIGWGSWTPEFTRFGVGPVEPPARVRRLRETLEVLRALWSGETMDYHGEFHQLKDAYLAPTPLGKIPVVIGGAGPKTLAVVRDFADWWNIPVSDLHRLEQTRPQVGGARVSVQQVVGYVHDKADRAAVTEAATRHFGAFNPVIGTATELADHFGRLREQGAERIYTWFSDFAQPETLAAFGEHVISQCP